jgi:hypothetical protein
VKFCARKARDPTGSAWHGAEGFRSRSAHESQSFGAPMQELTQMALLFVAVEIADVTPPTEEHRS